MVTLNKIYTKTGDRGTTALGDGTRVRKDSPLVQALGDVDEANAAIGVAIVALGHDSRGSNEAVSATLHKIQHDLFDVGADLCVPKSVSAPTPASNSKVRLRITLSHVAGLERAIDTWNAKLSPLKSFVLPGGCAAAANLHLARCIVRRAERSVMTLHRDANSSSDKENTARKEQVVETNQHQQHQQHQQDQQDQQNDTDQVGVYLNRLSDLLFVLARVVNDHGDSDVLWQPGFSINCPK